MAKSQPAPPLAPDELTPNPPDPRQDQPLPPPRSSRTSTHVNVTNPTPSSTPANCAGPNRPARSTAVVDAGVATADNACPALSARQRSNPVQTARRTSAPAPPPPGTRPRTSPDPAA